MTRLSVIGLAVVGGVLAAPGRAPAQFGGGILVPGLGPVRPVPSLPVPGLAPLGGLGVPLPNIGYYQRYTATINTGIGPSLTYNRVVAGPVGYWLNRQYPLFPNNPTPYPTIGTGYMSGSAAGVNPLLDNAKADFARAQRAAAAAVPAKAAIYDQWAYEKLGVTGVAAVKTGGDAPDAVLRALATTDEAEVATGEPLNHLLVAAIAAEKKAAKVDSAFLPPNLLTDLKFAGPHADAANLLRKGPRLDFPAGFDGPTLAATKADLDRDFTAAAGPVVSGKAADLTKAAKLEATVKKAREALGPTVRELSFEDATAVRRFLNQLDATARTLRGPGAIGLVDPAWQVQGTDVAGLVGYMRKHNLVFAAAEKGAEDRYVAVHRGLGAYVFALGEAQKKK